MFFNETFINENDILVYYTVLLDNFNFSFFLLLPIINKDIYNAYRH